VDFDTVQRVLAYFLARLWPEAVGAPVTRKRRRYVEARLRELAAGPHPELAEQTLRDAVDGARLHPWHREADTGFHADRVFRDADTVEQLAKLGRARRLQEARLAAGRGSPAPPVSTRSRADCAPAQGLSHAQMAADLERLFGRAWRKGA
jgi:hypothetical protein